MFTYPQVVGRSDNKEELMNLLKHSWKGFDIEIQKEEFKDGDLVQIVVDVYDDQYTYWIVGDYELEITKGVLNDTE